MDFDPGTPKMRIQCGSGSEALEFGLSFFADAVPEDLMRIWSRKNYSDPGPQHCRNIAWINKWPMVPTEHNIFCYSHFVGSGIISRMRIRNCNFGSGKETMD